MQQKQNNGQLPRWSSLWDPMPSIYRLRKDLSPKGFALVATEGATILGVAAMTKAGEITLNYVSPDARFRGISKALVGRLEAQARELGLDRCTLNSTETARKFYLALGYQEQIAPANGSCRSMAKALI